MIGEHTPGRGPAPFTREHGNEVEIIAVDGQVLDHVHRDYNVRCLVKRLHRIDNEMAGEARADFIAYVPAGDLAGFARRLPGILAAEFVQTMALLRDPGFQELLVSYKRPVRVFYVAYDVKDEVHSNWVVREAGVEYKPEDYLEAFSRFVRKNPDHIEAVRILLDRPRDWSPVALNELRPKLQLTRRFRMRRSRRRTRSATNVHSSMSSPW